MKKKLLRFIYNDTYFEGMLLYQTGRKNELIQKPIYEFYLNVPFYYQTDKILSHPLANQKTSYKNEKIALDEIIKEIVFEVLFYYTYKGKLREYEAKKDMYFQILQKKLPKIKEIIDGWQKELKEKFSEFNVYDKIVEDVFDTNILEIEIELELKTNPFLEEEKKLREEFKKDFDFEEVEFWERVKNGKN